jgi:hypothetical protein
LDAMHRREVVVLHFAQLEKATATTCQCLFYAQLGKTAGPGMQMRWIAARARTRSACGNWIDLLFTALWRLVDQQVDGNVTK